MTLAKVEVRNERFFTQVVEAEHVAVNGQFATDVSLNLDARQIASMGQQGDSLVIQTINGEVFVIKGFYAPNLDGKPNRLFVSDDGAIAMVDTYNPGSLNLYQAPPGTDGLTFTSADFNLPLGLLGAAGVGAGVGLAALAMNGGEDDIANPTISVVRPNADGTVTVSGSGQPNATITVRFPDGTTITEKIASDGSYGPITSESAQTSGDIKVTQSGANGSLQTVRESFVDDVAPLRPAAIEVDGNPDGTITISGTGEPGATIDLVLPSGEVISEIAVAEDGTFGPVTSTQNQPEGDIVITQTDAAGNTSAGTTKTYEDATPPAAPVITSVSVNDDGTISVSGTGEPGATVDILLPSGETLANVAVDPDGTFGPATSTENQPSGTITISQVDAEGNVSTTETAVYNDETPPQGPVIDTVTADSDGTVTILGTGEPGATIVLTLPSGEVISGIVVSEDGTFGPVVSTENQPSGPISAVQTDEAGNVSEPAATVYTDETPPEAPNVDVVSANPDGTLTISGRGEPGSTVDIVLPSGETINNIPVAGDGTFGPVTSIDLQPTGDVIATQTDDAGNVSEAGSQTYRDATPPDAPTINNVLVDDQDGTVTIFGSGEPGSTVTVTFPSGEVVANVEVGVNGLFGPVVSAQTQPSGTISAVQIDIDGNSSAAGTQSYVDAVAPDSPVISATTANPTGTVTLSGTGEPGATVEITLPSGEVLSGITVAVNGNWGPVTSTQIQSTGSITATQTDDAGNTSPVSTASFSDATPPRAPDIDSVSSNLDGTITISGTGEPGAEVTIVLPTGEVINNIPVATDGTFGPVTSTENQPSGQILATQTDEAGNTSAPLSQTFTDVTAPGAPNIATVIENDNGTLTVFGSGEPGSTVQITMPSGEVIANIAVGNNGQFGPVTSSDIQTSGNISATQTDAEGNVSAPDTQAYTDTIAPNAPIIDTLTPQPNGAVSIAGTAEPGATISVTFPSGETVTGIVAGTNGSWGPVVSTEVQSTGSISATQTDLAGNVSPARSISYIDGTAPLAPTIDAITNNPDGTITLSGTGESGSTVDLVLPSGEIINNVPVASDGTFGPVTSTENQPSGQIFSSQTDAAGNTSAQSVETFNDGATPSAPSIDSIVANNDGTISLFGTGEPGATLTVTMPSGEIIANVPVASNGTFGPVVSSQNQPSGTVSVTQTDAEGNTSAADTQAYTDATPPPAPSFSAIIANNDGTISVQGSAEPNSTIDITMPSGEVFNNVPVASNGTWGPVTSTENQPNGFISATQTDVAGNTSPATAQSYSDQTAPGEPTIDTVTQNLDGTVTISGTGEPGATVSITLPNGEVITNVPVAIDGSYGPVTSVTAQEESGNILADQSDDNGNTSVVATRTFIEAVVPDAPVINPTDGVLITGSGEPGATVNLDITGDGNPDQTILVGQDGTWNYSPGAPVADNTQISATQTDEAGNESAVSNIVVPNDANGDLVTDGMASPIMQTSFAAFQTDEVAEEPMAFEEPATRELSVDLSGVSDVLAFDLDGFGMSEQILQPSAITADDVLDLSAGSDELVLPGTDEVLTTAQVEPAPSGVSRSTDEQMFADTSSGISLLMTDEDMSNFI